MKCPWFVYVGLVLNVDPEAKKHAHLNGVVIEDMTVQQLDTL